MEHAILRFALLATAANALPNIKMTKENAQDAAALTLDSSHGDSSCATYACPFYSKKKEPAHFSKCEGGCNDPCPGSMGFVLSEEKGTPALDHAWDVQILADGCTQEEDVKACCFRTALDSGLPGIVAVVYGPEVCGFWHRRHQPDSNVMHYVTSKSQGANLGRGTENISSSATRCLRTDSSFSALKYPHKLTSKNEQACCTTKPEASVSHPSDLGEHLMSFPALANAAKLARKLHCWDPDTCLVQPMKDSKLVDRHLPTLEHVTLLPDRTVPDYHETPIKRHRLFDMTTSGGVKMAMCLMEKSGSSAWIQLLHADLVMKTKSLAKSAMSYAVAKMSGVPSITFVRNPYTRLLSAFLDKVVRHQRGFTFSGNFEEFVEALCIHELAKLRGEEPCTPGKKGCAEGITYSDIHIELQAWKCGLHQGLVYDFVFKLEEQPMWYETVIRMLGLKDTVQYYDGAHGLSIPKNESNCFYKPPGVDRCSDLFKTAEPKMYNGLSTSGHLDLGSHAKHANDNMKEHITPETAQAMTALLHKDLTRFEYPIYDGKDPDHFDPLLGEVPVPMSTEEQINALEHAVDKLQKKRAVRVAASLA